MHGGGPRLSGKPFDVRARERGDLDVESMREAVAAMTTGDVDVESMREAVATMTTEEARAMLRALEEPPSPPAV